MTSIAHQVTYRDFETSPALNAIIEKRLDKLQRYSSDIKSSRVVLESPHNHKHKGKQFKATIELDVKGETIALSHEDSSIHVAVRDMFSAAERKLKSHSEQLHRHLDKHARQKVIEEKALTG